MAAIAPALDTAIKDVPRIIWAGVTPGDTLDALLLKQQYGLAASVQAVGTFGGATITMQVSNDGTNWASVNDVNSATVTMTAATQYFEMSLSSAYIRGVIAGGSGSDIDVILVLRGSSGV